MKRAQKRTQLTELSARRPLRVFTMNIWNFAGSYERRQKLLRAGIRELDPDLLAFQEAGYDGKRDQVREMLKGFDYHVMHQFDRRPVSSPSRDNGCCVASRWPFEVIEVLPMQVTAACAGYPYAAMAVRVSAPEPVGPMLFVCAKPSWQLNRELEREMQAVELARMINRHARRDAFPPIIAGDFDAAPDNASIRFLTGRQALAGLRVHYWDAWEQAGGRSAGYTWTHRNVQARQTIDAVWRQERHERRIDYIFLGSPHDYPHFARLRTCRVVLDKQDDGVWPSDHYAVYAEVDVVPAERGPGGGDKK